MCNRMRDGDDGVQNDHQHSKASESSESNVHVPPLRSRLRNTLTLIILQPRPEKLELTVESLCMDRRQSLRFRVFRVIRGSFFKRRARRSTNHTKHTKRSIFNFSCTFDNEAQRQALPSSEEQAALPDFFISSFISLHRRHHFTTNGNSI